jgi:hypothetical protein
MAFTVAPVPTGMNAGVRITPRGIRISPTRAAPSVFMTVKVKVSDIPACLTIIPAEGNRARIARSWPGQARP